jgi:phage terminase large subunit-like protein
VARGDCTCRELSRIPSGQLTQNKILTDSLRDKHARIQAFSVRVENGAFLLRGEGGMVDPSQQELLDEMLSFPLGKHDDLLDAAAFGSAYLLDTPEPRIFG